MLKVGYFLSLLSVLFKGSDTLSPNTGRLAHSSLESFSPERPTVWSDLASVSPLRRAHKYQDYGEIFKVYVLETNIHTS